MRENINLRDILIYSSHSKLEDMSTIAQVDDMAKFNGYVPMKMEEIGRIVDIARDCYQKLRSTGYTGPLSIIRPVDGEVFLGIPSCLDKEGRDNPIPEFVNWVNNYHPTPTMDEFLNRHKPAYFGDDNLNNLEESRLGIFVSSGERFERIPVSQNTEIKRFLFKIKELSFFGLNKCYAIHQQKPGRCS